MTKVCLLDDHGQPEFDFQVPDEESMAFGRAGSVEYQNRSYRFTNYRDGIFYLEPFGAPIVLKEEWRR